MDYTDLYNFQESNGVIYPSTEEVLEGVQEKFKDIFGADIDMSEETPLGRLIEAFVVVIQSAVGVTAQASNQINVEMATGTYLDSLASIYNIKRWQPSKSSCAIKVYFESSDTNLVMPKGTRILNAVTYDTFIVEADIYNKPHVENGENVYYGTGIANALNEGLSSCDVGDLKIIQGNIPGVKSVTNTSIISLGNEVETDESLRQRIIKSRYLGVGSVQSMITRLTQIRGIYSAIVLENHESDVIYKKGVAIPAHSIFICIYTASSATSEELESNVSHVIAATKPVGVGMLSSDYDLEALGATPHVVEYETENYSSEISFWTAVEIPFSVKISVNSSLYNGTNLQDEVKDAVSGFINGTGIGEVIYATELASSVQKTVGNIVVLNIEFSIGSSDGTRAVQEIDSNSVVLYGFQKAISSTDSVSVTEQKYYYSKA